MKVLVWRGALVCGSI